VKLLKEQHFEELLKIADYPRMLLLILSATVPNISRNSRSHGGNVGNYKNRTMRPVTHAPYVLVCRNTPSKRKKPPVSNNGSYRLRYEGGISFYSK
jgi:hypothetical protein